jgi:hypothetical protein
MKLPVAAETRGSSQNSIIGTYPKPLKSVSQPV